MDKDFFKRGVAEIINEESLKKRLKSSKKIRVKFGVDPTSTDIHLGHAVTLKKLRDFQEAGHTVIFLIGDYTTKVGDPSGRNTTRPILSDQEIEENAQTYLAQVGKILDVKKTEIRRNSEWFSKLSFNDILQIAGKFTVAQILERDDFEKRLKGGLDLGLHEVLYPLMQAYDSVALKADVEMGGTDQKFNLLAGRILQKKFGQEPQEIIMMKLLVGLDGKQKMSKSLGNYVGISEVPDSQFGKIMSIPDNLITEYFELCTDLSESEINKIKDDIAGGENPRDCKEKLASEIVKLYHGEKSAKEAKENFNKRFRDKELPSDLPILDIPEKNIDLLTMVILADERLSKSQARRLIEQGGVKIDGVKIGDPNQMVGIPREGVVIEVGKIKVFRIK